MVAVTRGLDRGRTDQGAVDAAFASDLARLIEVESEAGLDFYSDGLLRWQDVFRPVVAGMGPEPHELVRWFDTNTFFRAPEIASVNKPRRAPLTATTLPKPQVVTLPSPYTFSRAVHNATNRNQLMHDLAERVLHPAIEMATAGGAEVIHLEEPWLTYYGIDEADWRPFHAAIDSLTNRVAVPVILHCYFGDAGPHLGKLKEMSVGIGVDLTETDVNALGRNWEDKNLLIGCLNGRSSVMESLDATAELARQIADTIHPMNLYLSSSCELQYLPTTVAEQKVRRLGEVARKAKELVAA